MRSIVLVTILTAAFGSPTLLAEPAWSPPSEAPEARCELAPPSNRAQPSVPTGLTTQPVEPLFGVDRTYNRVKL